VLSEKYCGGNFEISENEEEEDYERATNGGREKEEKGSESGEGGGGEKGEEEEEEGGEEGGKPEFKIDIQFPEISERSCRKWKSQILDTCNEKCTQQAMMHEDAWRDAIQIGK
jgi:hypothetical protein